MPRRTRHAALPRLILLAAAAMVGSAPPGTGPARKDHAVGAGAAPSWSSLLSAAEATQIASSLHSSERRVWWGAAPRYPRQQRDDAHNPSAATPAAWVDRQGTAVPVTCGRSSGGGSSAPLWVRARGGAGTRVDGRPLRDGLGDSAVEENAELLEEQGVDGDEEETNEVVDEADVDASSPVDDDHETGEDEGAAVDATEDEEEKEEDGEEGSPSAKTERAAAAAAAAAAKTVPASESVLQLGVVLPAVMKSGAAFLTGTWLAKKLSPGVEGHVRIARMIYTAYLIVSQALCMYLRYLIWQKDDNTAVEIPPPPQLKKMVEGVGSTGTGGGEAGDAAGAAAGGLGGAASSLAPMLDKMLTSKTPAKAYDMKAVQGIRRGQFWASLFMCFTHLKRGMIKPMMLQVSFGLLSLLDSPLFKIYVLGQEATGELARPFKKQGLMAKLTGPMETMAAKAEEARVAAEAAASKGKEGREDVASDGDEGADAHADVDEDADGVMPDIEALTDSDGED